MQERRRRRTGAWGEVIGSVQGRAHCESQDCHSAVAGGAARALTLHAALPLPAPHCPANAGAVSLSNPVPSPLTARCGPHGGRRRRSAALGGDWAHVLGYVRSLWGTGRGRVARQCGTGGGAAQGNWPPAPRLCCETSAVETRCESLLAWCSSSAPAACPPDDAACHLDHPPLPERLLSPPKVAPPQTQPPPPSELLARVAQFLPRMAAANEQLVAAAAAAPPGTFDVEAVAEGEAHVEMDLACGVLDLKDDGAVVAAERALASGGGVDDGGGPGAGETSSDEEDDSVEEDEESGAEAQEKAGAAGGGDSVAKPPAKPGAKRRRPGIQEL